MTKQPKVFSVDEARQMLAKIQGKPFLANTKKRQPKVFTADQVRAMFAAVQRSQEERWGLTAPLSPAKE